VLEDGERTFIVMEYVEGESLAARIARGPLPAAEVRTIGRQLAAALIAAHAQGVVHRDLKPANVQVKPGGSIKVLDFGVAKLSAPIASSTVAQTATAEHEGTLDGNPGTPIYMSPEQLYGREVDARSDIYSQTRGARAGDVFVASAFGGVDQSGCAAGSQRGNREDARTRRGPAMPVGARPRNAAR